MRLVVGWGWPGQLFNFLGLARIVRRPCMPEAQVWGFLNVPLLLPQGRRTLPCVAGSLGLAQSFLLFLWIVADLWCHFRTWTYSLSPGGRCFDFYPSTQKWTSAWEWDSRVRQGWEEGGMSSVLSSISCFLQMLFS